MIKKGKYIAVRPNALIEARYDLTSRQNDIMDMVLSKLENDGNSLYELNVNDYRKLYKGDTSNIYRDLKKAVKSMEGKGFYLINSIDNGIEKETFFVWFASIDYLDKEGKMIVEIGQRLKGLLIEMKKRIYYKIEYPLNFSSIYSKRLYYYMKSFEDTGWRIDNLNKLREKMQCPKSYDKYGLFRTKALDIAYEEINNYSDISFEYEEIKTGRKVTSIKFIIENNKKVNAPSDEVVTDKENALDSLEKRIDYTMKIIKDIKINASEALSICNSANSDMELILKAYEYVNSKKKTNNPVGYIIDTIERMKNGTFNKPKQNKNTSSTNFNNFEPRDIYNDEIAMDKLEKTLLGWDND